MPNDPEQPIVGELKVDATALGPDLIDLPPGALQRLRTEQPDFPPTLIEILANQEAFGERAGITPLVFQELLLANQRIDAIDARLPAARKLVEVLEESRALRVDQRQRLVSTIAQTVELHAKARGDEEILGRYALTRAYRSAIANKAARTRRRNEKLADAPEETPDETPDETPETPAI
jgi:hypothetical protein